MVYTIFLILGIYNSAYGSELLSICIKIRSQELYQALRPNSLFVCDSLRATRATKKLQGWMI